MLKLIPRIGEKPVRDYQRGMEYIDGKKELKDINMAFQANYESGADGPTRGSCEMF